MELLSDKLRAGGLDLMASTTVQAYNDRVPLDFALPDFDRTSTAVIVVGNTASLWPHLGPIWDLPEYRNDPVDTYTTKVINDVVADTVDVAYEVRFSYEAPPRRVAIQRLAQLAGLAWLGDSNLSVHPTYGPWIAWRAAIVVDADGRVADPIGPTCDCSTGCLPAFNAAISGGTPESKAEFEHEWEKWLAFRDACPVGREHRYSDEQIRYHYTEDRSARPPA